MTIPYEKFSAQGNAFVIVEEATLNAPLTPQQITHWAQQDDLTSFDQLLLVGRSRFDQTWDVAIFNADGSMAEQCGNGMRAVAQFLYRTEKVADATSIRLNPPAGLVRVTEFEAYDEARAWVGVQLPGPREIESTGIPMNTPCLAAYRVSMGNPHLILIWPHPPSHEECQSVGATLQAGEPLTGGINVSLAHWAGDAVKLRVYERGVGPTLACGSGACATAAAVIRHFKSSRRLKIDQPGGSVVVNWPATDSPSHPIELAGDVQRLGEGCLHWIQSV